MFYSENFLNFRPDDIKKTFFAGDLFQIIAPLCGPTSIQFLNGAEGRGRRQLYDKSFLHENLHVYTEGLQKVHPEMSNVELII